MAKSKDADQYHKQFADSIITALKEGTAPWQKPWIWHAPSNFSGGQADQGSRWERP